jgi:hypothetical protein
MKALRLPARIVPYGGLLQPTIWRMANENSVLGVIMSLMAISGQRPAKPTQIERRKSLGGIKHTIKQLYGGKYMFRFEKELIVSHNKSQYSQYRPRGPPVG